MAKKKGLGRGLSALMADVTEAPEQATDQSAAASAQSSDLVVPIEKIVPNPDQPRRTFVEATWLTLQAPFVKKVSSSR